MFSKIGYFIIIFGTFYSINSVAEEGKVKITYGNNNTYNDVNYTGSDVETGIKNALTNLPSQPSVQSPRVEDVQNNNKDNRNTILQTPANANDQQTQNSDINVNPLDRAERKRRSRDDTKSQQQAQAQERVQKTAPPPKITSNLMDNESTLRAQNELKKRLADFKNVKLTPEQIAAVDMPLPVTSRISDVRTQLLPSNIAQRVYNRQNNHLIPTMLLADYAINIFTLIDQGDRSSKESIKAMIEALDEPIVLDGYGNSFLMHAIFKRRYEIMMYLLNRGVDPNMRNSFQVAPIHLATFAGDHIATVALIEAGADPNLRDGNGNTPLMYAALSGNVNLAKRVVDYGGELGARNLHKLSVMDFAYHSQNLQMVNYLMSKGNTLLIQREAQSIGAMTDASISTTFAQNLIENYRTHLTRAEYFYYAR